MLFDIVRDPLVDGGVGQIRVARGQPLHSARLPLLESDAGQAAQPVDEGGPDVPLEKEKGP